MDIIKNLVEIMMNLPSHLDRIITILGPFTYLILWLNMFLETGAVIMAFLPGEALIVAAAAFSAISTKLDIRILIPLFLTATFIGDTCSFFIGRFAGKKYQDLSQMKLIKPNQLKLANQFFEEKGKKAYLINRFIPIARAFMPFTAGFSQVKYRKVFPYSIAGIFIWNSLYIFLGYFFGNLPFVKKNFSLVALAVVVISLIPASVFLARNIKKIVSGKFFELKEKGKARRRRRLDKLTQRKMRSKK